MTVSITQSIAIIGGTGNLGPGLAGRFAAAGKTVIIGSRDAGKAEAAGATVIEHVGPAARVTGLSNADAAAAATCIVVTVPFAAVVDTLSPLAETLIGKTVISAVVPLRFGSRGPETDSVAEGSAAEQIAALLPGARITAAFQSVDASQLTRLDTPVVADVLICGDDVDAVATTAELVALIPSLRPIHVGGLHLSRHVEGLTAVLISVNRRYKAHSGVQLTGVTIPSEAAKG